MSSVSQECPEVNHITNQVRDHNFGTSGECLPRCGPVMGDRQEWTRDSFQVQNQTRQPSALVSGLAARSG
eukprot:3749024-Amphidinium_carterae.1